MAASRHKRYIVTGQKKRGNKQVIKNQPPLQKEKEKAKPTPKHNESVKK